MIFSTVAGYAAVPLCFERRGAGHFEASVGLSRPQYMVAFASNRAISALPSSVYIDTGQLGMLNSTETASLLADANASCTVERDRADAAEAENNRFRDEANAYQARLAGIEADLNASQSESTAARGETRGLLVANEMAEQACTVLRSELSHAREAIVEQARAAMRSELSREALSLEEVTVAKEAEPKNWRRHCCQLRRRSQIFEHRIHGGSRPRCVELVVYYIDVHEPGFAARAAPGRHCARPVLRIQV